MDFFLLLLLLLLVLLLSFSLSLSLSLSPPPPRPRGCLKRNKQWFDDFSTETSNYSRMSEAKPAIARGCPKRNKQSFEGVSSETLNYSRTSQATQTIVRGCPKRNKQLVFEDVLSETNNCSRMSSETSNSSRMSQAKLLCAPATVLARASRAFRASEPRNFEPRPQTSKHGGLQAHG